LAKIIFETNRDGDNKRALYTMNVDGSDQRELANSKSGDDRADW